MIFLDITNLAAKVSAFSSAPFPAELRSELLALNSAGDNELHRAALAANALTRVYAQVVESIAGPIKPQTHRYSCYRRAWANRATSTR